MLDEVLSGTPLPGELFAEKYRIERTLGRGGMGVVVAATHVHLQERYALKILLPSAMTDPVKVERFLREGRASVKIRSDHVARIFDVGELPDHTPYIVMEHLEGSDFGELLEAQSAFPTPTAVDYVLEACEAIAEAHALGIIHRDLKPSNLFLARREDGRAIVKVLDFGISKLASLEPGLSVTRTASIMGSPLYMSPEQLKSARDVDARSDLWSVAVILYQLIGGEPPFVADSLAELCAVILSGRVPWLTDIAPSVPDGLSAVIATGLRPDPAERYQNLADFAEAVAPFGTAKARASAARIVDTLGLPATRAKTYRRPRTQSTRSLWIGAGALALVAAAAGGATLVRGREAPAPAAAADRVAIGSAGPSSALGIAVAVEAAAPPASVVVPAPPAPSAPPAESAPKARPPLRRPAGSWPILSAQPPPASTPAPAPTSSVSPLVPLGAATSSKD